MLPTLLRGPPWRPAGDWGWGNHPGSSGAERQRRKGQPKLSFQNLIAEPQPQSGKLCLLFTRGPEAEGSNLGPTTQNQIFHLGLAAFGKSICISQGCPIETNFSFQALRTVLTSLLSNFIVFSSRWDLATSTLLNLFFPPLPPYQPIQHGVLPFPDHLVTILILSFSDLYLI